MFKNTVFFKIIIKVMHLGTFLLIIKCQLGFKNLKLWRQKLIKFNWKVMLNANYVHKTLWNMFANPVHRQEKK